MPNKGNPLLTYLLYRENSSISSIRIPTGSVVNMDEISIRFGAVPTVTLKNRGARTVRVLSAGNALQYTVLLAVSMDGTKLPPTYNIQRP